MDFEKKGDSKQIDGNYKEVSQGFRDCTIVEDDIEVDDLVEDFFKDDEDEHIFLDSILADIGTIPLEVEEASDWERAAHDT